MNFRRAVELRLIFTLLAAGVAGCSKPAANPPVPAPTPPSAAAAPAAATPAASAPASPPVIAQPTAAAKPTPAVMAPVIPAATAAPASTATASTADPQQDLKTAIPDLLRIVKGGDFKTLVQTYAAPAKRAALLSMFDPSSDPDFQKMPPEAQAMILQTMQGPEMKAQLNEMMQTLIAGLESIQDATPTYNDAGDKATYKVTLPPGSTPAGATPPDSGPGGKDSDDLTFVKVDGRWFMDM